MVSIEVWKKQIITIFSFNLLNILVLDARLEPLQIYSEIEKLQLLEFFNCQNETDGIKNDDGCSPDFDGWGCWPATNEEEVRSIPCPTLTNHINNYSLVQGNSTRKCNITRQWEDADYSTCFPDDQIRKPETESLISSLKFIQKLLSEEYKTVEVRQAYMKCLLEIILKPATDLPGLHCPRIFDGWGCWNDTLAGTTAYRKCPADLVLGFSDRQFAHKVCQTNGQWFRYPETNHTWSNYTTCVDEDDLNFRRIINLIYIGGYSVSVMALFISLIIFSSFRALNSTRISIHKNLFISFIVNNTGWIIWYAEVVNKPEIILANQIGCQILHVIVQYFLVCNYLWMFCEGLFLFTILVSAFIAEDSMMKWFYLTGWGAPGILTVIYAAVRATRSPAEIKHCWINDSPFLWILSGPVCVSMLLNVAFLIKIVTVLINKLRNGNTMENNQTRKAVRATLILIPLLGLHYILTPFRPETKSQGEQIYETVSAIVTSFQGLCVSFLFCFTNGEVHHLLKKKLDEIMLKREVEMERTVKVRQSVVYEDKC